MSDGIEVTQTLPQENSPREEPKIVGILSWYDESPHWLATAVSGFARVCDSIVAVDGAYALYPGARPRSHPQQAEAIMGACESAEVGCTIHRPADVFWGNEVEKRNLSLRLAAPLLRPDVDWVMVFDADCHMLRCDPALVRFELKNTDCNVADYTTLDGKDFLADAALHEYAASRQIDHEWTGRTRDIYRWHPTLEYGPMHWTVSHLRSGERSWLRAPWEQDLVEPVHHLNAALAVYHRTQDRSMQRRMNADHYYKTRDVMQIEPEEQIRLEEQRVKQQAEQRAAKPNTGDAPVSRSTIVGQFLGGGGEDE